MRVIIACILASTIILFTPACTKNEETQLKNAETLLIQNPDSVLRILSTDNHNNPLNIILRTIAADLTNAPLPGDSIIAKAREHYISKNNKKMLFLSLYCTGRKYQLQNHQANAMLQYTQAEQLLEWIDNPAYAALLYSRIAQLYANSFNYNRALDYYNNAHLHFKAAGAKKHEHSMLVKKAQTLIELKYYGETETLLLDELNWGYENNNKEISQNCIENLLQLYHRTGYHTKADWLLTSDYFSLCDSTAAIDRTLAYMYAANNNMKLSNRHMRRAWKSSSSISDTLTNLMHMYDISKMRGEYNNALPILENIHYIHDTIMRSALTQPMLSAQRDFYRSQVELGNYRLATTKRMAVAAIIATLMLLCIIVLILRNRIQAKNIEIERYADLADETSKLLHAKSQAYDNVSSQLLSHNEKVQLMEQQIGVLFKKQFELLNELSGTFYETREIKKDKEAIYRQVRENIDGLMKNKGSVQLLEEIVNNYRNNVMQKLRTQVTQLGEQEYRFMIFVYAGFSSKAISIFMQESLGNVYTKKSRIKSIISRSEAPEKDSLLEAMNL